MPTRREFLALTGRGLLLSSLGLAAGGPLWTAAAAPLPKTHGAAASDTPWDAGCTSNAVIDPAAFARNIETLRKAMGPDVRLCIVMKSDAYGHGVENLIDPALAARPACIAMVGNRDIRIAAQAMERAGTSVPILRIAPATAYEAGQAALNGWPVEELATSLDHAAMLSRVAAWVGKKRNTPGELPVHINIDTGMGRMGFMRTEDVKAALKIPGLKVRGVMTHFANAGDMDRGEALTRKQVARYETVLDQLDLPEDVVKHTANSEAALRFPWTRFNMVRVGGALYGDIPEEINPNGAYERTMPTFATRVAWIMRDVPPGTTVGYGSLYRTPRDGTSTLATIRVGYDNGLSENAFQNGAQVLIRGRRFPVVGKTSMNLLVVNVSDQDPANPVKLGDEALLWGKQGKETITLEEAAKAEGTTTCAMLLAFGKSNPRILAENAPGSCFSACSPPQPETAAGNTL